MSPTQIKFLKYDVLAIQSLIPVLEKFNFSISQGLVTIDVDGVTITLPDDYRSFDDMRAELWKRAFYILALPK